MGKSKGYPLLSIDRKKVYENAKRIVEICKEHNISVSGVIKGTNGMEWVAKEMFDAGCGQIASSRLDQLISVRKHMPAAESMLLRIPMQCEINDMVKNVDFSLNSEWQTVEWIEKACKKHQRTHGVILMMDLGDLREGFFDEKELIDLALHIENDLECVTLAGIGTNLGCYGSVKPTVKNLGQLAELAARLENQIGRKLRFVSGGATPSLVLLNNGEMPEGINHLRIGEAILLNMDIPELWKVDLGRMHNDTFVLKAQIVEIKRKPSYPVGERFVDAFGRMPEYEDRGIKTRALLAVGKQDFAMENLLVPVDDKIEIIGSSSDHLIVEIQDSAIMYKIGDVMEFRMFYGAMLHLCTSEWVRKTY